MPLMDHDDAMMEALELQLVADFGVIDNPTGDGLIIQTPVMPVDTRFYGYKQRSEDADRANIERPCLIVQHLAVPDGDVPKIAGHHPFIARCGVVVYIQTPLGFRVGNVDKGGRDNLLQPLSYAFDQWVKTHPALAVPESIRYHGGPTGTLVFPPEMIDVRRASPYRVLGIRSQYERITYHLTLEALEVS